MASTPKTDQRDSRGRLVLGTMAKQNGEMSFVCAICDGGFMNLKKYQVHMDIHRPFEPRTETPEVIALDSSDDEIEVDKPNPNAASTESLTGRAEDRKRRLKSSSDVEEASSSHVAKKNRSNDDYSEISDSSSEELYDCVPCEQTFSSFSGWKNHFIGCFNKPCTICGATFTSKLGRCNHQKKHHQNELPEHCELCPEAFASKRESIRHKKVFHALDETVQCKICNEWFWNDYIIEEHVKEEHPLNCSICGEIIDTVRALQEHKEHSHQKPGEK